MSSGVATEWVPEHLDLESDQIRQVYATYGLAMYYAQVLEHGLVNFVVATRTGCSVKTLEECDALFEELLAMTMGRQLRRVLEAAELDTALVERLRGALRLRNRLAHDYFRERVVDFASFAGRNRMIEELAEIRAELEAADQKLEPLTLALLRKWGVTRERLAAEVAQLRARATEQGDGSGSFGGSE